MEAHEKDVAALGPGIQDIRSSRNLERQTYRSDRPQA
jgi:hypothetical protein